MESVKSKGERIVIYTNEFYPRIGGIGTYVEEMANAAEGMGYDVEVVAPRQRWKRQDREFNFRVKWRRGVRNVYSWFYVLYSGIYLLMDRRRYSDATLFLPQSGVWEGLMYCGLFGLVKAERIIFALHGTEILELSAGRVRKYLLGRVLRRGDRVTVLSDYCRKLLLERYPELKERVVSAPGAARRAFEYTFREARRSDGKVILLTVGRIDKRKGQTEVVKALSRLNKEEKGMIEYWIVGPVVDVGYYEEIRLLVEYSGVDVVFKGGLCGEELLETYAQADIFVMSSRRQGIDVEGFGLSYLEASAAGLPVVGYRTGGVREVVVEGETGYLVDEGDVEGLAHKLSSLIKDEEKREAMGRMGMNWAKGFSWEKSAQQVFM